MATYYVDQANGSDSYDGTVPVFTTGTTGPKATANGAEDVATSAGDVIVFRGGEVHRYAWTCDNSGSSGAGNRIVARADVDGDVWPGSTGPVVFTGSNNDETGSRSTSLDVSSRSYRDFHGFQIRVGTFFSFPGPTDLSDSANVSFFDCLLQHRVRLDASTAIGFYRCVLDTWYADGSECDGIELHDSFIFLGGSFFANAINVDIRRCTTLGSVTFAPTATISGGEEWVIEDCLFLGSVTYNCASGYILSDNNKSITSINYTGGITSGEEGASTETGLGSMPYTVFHELESGGALGVPRWSLAAPRGAASATTELSFNGIPRVASTPADCGALQAKDFERVDVGSGVSGLNLPPGASFFFGANVDAGQQYTVSCNVTGSGTMTNEPYIALIEDRLGVSATSDTASDSESGPEAISLTFTPSSTGVIRFCVINPDTTEDVQVVDCQVVES